MQLDILAFSAHPDDVELCCAGTIIKHVEFGFTAGIVDLTRGELGTRGSAELREQEAANAGKIMGISIRENLGLADGFFEITEANKLEIVRIIRKYRPRIVIANAVFDRHPDHGRASRLVSDSCFLAGLIKIETRVDGQVQEAWRPRAVYHYIQDRLMKPDFIVDISAQIKKRKEAIMAFSSQFYNPGSNEPETVISTKQFLESLDARALEFGRIIGVEFGEAFVVERIPGINNFFDLV